ncbi:MAG: IS481 family transposase [Burkholderiales bacterium]|nr:IS481 family transposase [Burkholderiales bacterium]
MRFALQPESNIRELCRRYGVCPATGYKWLGRYLNEGEAGLEERSRRPVHSPCRTDCQIESQILEAARKWPVWGARKLKAWLERQGHVMPAASTIHTILRRNGLHEAKGAPSRSVGRFEHEAPNQLWQMDFKGHFEADAGRCHPLTLLDDHSRYLLCLSACSDEKRQTVQSRLIEVFTRYGLPERMTMDNGAPWGDTTGRWTALELWLMRQGIGVGHSRPYHPQTQGKLERLHATLKSELLQGRRFTGFEQTTCFFDHWRQCYNQERPHEALTWQVPSERYRPSIRSYNPNPAPPEYDPSMSVRKGDSSGKLSFKNHSVKIGKAFIGEFLGIREEKGEGIYSLWWYSTKIGLIDLKQGAVYVGKSF